MSIYSMLLTIDVENADGDGRKGKTLDIISLQKFIFFADLVVGSDQLLLEPSRRFQPLNRRSVGHSLNSTGERDVVAWTTDVVRRYDGDGDLDAVAQPRTKQNYE